jgi:hypothetical protein
MKQLSRGSIKVNVGQGGTFHDESGNAVFCPRRPVDRQIAAESDLLVLGVVSQLVDVPS